MKLPLPGDVFDGRYTVIEPLGKGGFATVYRAKVLDERLVALKILKPDDDGYARDVHSRFVREVQILATLRDPHTVRLFDHGQSADGLLFMVFEHLPGRDLDDVLDEVRCLEPDLTIRLIRQLGAALREAHTKKLLHRDLKPANVRIYEHAGDPWRVKLLDFGIARAMLDGESNITKTGELIGTPRYMSPEQLMGAELGPTSDIYSLGLLAFEMLLGPDILRQNSWGAQIERLQTGHMFSIPQTDQIGAGLVAIIQRMSAREPGERFQSIEAVLSALDALERGEFVPPGPGASTSNPRVPLPPASRSDPSLPPATAPLSTEIRPRRRPTDLITIAALLVALVVGAALLALKVAEPEPAKPVPPRRTEVPFVQTADEPEPAAAAAPRDAGLTIDKVDLGTIEGGSEGCGFGEQWAGRSPRLRDLGIMHEGQVVVPQDYTPETPHPLVIAFHEDMQTTDSFMDQSLLDVEAEGRGYVLVAPLGTLDQFPWRTRGQVRHIKGIVDAVKASVCIDERRVFIVGHGSGGMAAHFLSCDGWASAVATVSYRPGQLEIGEHCNSPPIRHLQFHATKSQRMPIDGGGQVPCAPSPKLSLDDFEKHWRERNKCSKRHKVYRREKQGTCLEYMCEEPLISCRLNSGHGFPGGTNESPLNQLFCNEYVADFPARDVIFDFFDAHPEP